MTHINLRPQVLKICSNLYITKTFQIYILVLFIYFFPNEHHLLYSLKVPMTRTTVLKGTHKDGPKAVLTVMKRENRSFREWYQ